MSKLVRESDVAVLNGHIEQNGHIPEDDERVFYFASGDVAELVPVPQFLLDRMRKRLPEEPEPPLQEVDGINGITLEKNFSHPDYLQAKAEYSRAIILMQDAIMLALGVKVEIDEARLNRTLRALAKTGEIVEFADDDDKLIFYVKEVLCSSVTEYRMLAEKLTALSNPTEERVQKHIKRFRR